MWCRSSFRQLSGIQQRQVGSLVTVALLENLWGKRPIEKICQSALTHNVLYQSCFLPSLRTISGNEGILNYQEFLADQLEVSYRLYGSAIRTVASQQIEILFQLVVASIPSVVSYPYISADELQNRLKVMESDFLLTFSSSARSHILNWTHVLQHILLRYLCECGSPIKNTALEASCSSELSSHLLSLLLEDSISLEHMMSHFERWGSDIKDSCDISDTVALMLRLCLYICDGSRSINSGLKKLDILMHDAFLRLDNSQTSPIMANQIKTFFDCSAIYSAALLGSKHSAQNIPCHFLETCRDADLICSLAVQMVQVSWNPNYSRAGIVSQS